MGLEISVIIKDITKKMKMKVHHSTNIKELKYLVFNKKFGFQEKLSLFLTKESKCIHASMLLKENMQLKELDLNNKKNLPIIKIFLEEKGILLLEKFKDDPNFEDQFKNNDNDDIYILKNLNENKNKEDGEHIEESQDFHPILTKSGYFTVPPISFLKNCAFETLMSIEDFTIYNDEGKIHFPGETDLTYVNLDEIVEITAKFIEVYPDETKKPSVGFKLNRSAILTFNSCKIWKNRHFSQINHKKVLEKLKNIAIREEGKILKYDQENGQWQMEVLHFTKYGIILDDDDSSAEDENEEGKEFEDERNNQPKEESELKKEKGSLRWTIEEKNLEEEEELESSSDSQGVKEEENDNYFKEEQQSYEKEQENNKKSQPFFEEQPNEIKPEFSPAKPNSLVPKKEDFFESLKTPEYLEDLKETGLLKIDSYSEIINEFHKEEVLREYGIEIYEISGYDVENRKLNEKLTALDSRVFKNINQNPKGIFYQNYSFRPSFCPDGFSGSVKNKNGYYSVDIMKFAVYNESFQLKEEKNIYNYLNYLEDLEEIKKKYQIFFGILFEENQSVFQSKSEFMKKIMKFLVEYSQRLLNNRESYQKNKEFFSKELVFICLLDILFGKPPLQLIKIAKLFGKKRISPEFLSEFFKKCENYAYFSEGYRKVLLEKWFELKAEKVNNWFFFQITNF